MYIEISTLVVDVTGNAESVSRDTWDQKVVSCRPPE